jgi:lysophospholipase L1-like esterase
MYRDLRLAFGGREDSITLNSEWINHVNSFNHYPADSSQVVIAGDSRISQSMIAEAIASVQCVNRGIPGDTSEGLTARWQPFTNAKAVIIAIGINDILTGIPEEETIRNISHVADSLNTASPRTALSILEIAPVAHTLHHAERTNQRVELLNGALQRLCADKGINWIPFPDCSNAEGNLRNELTTDGLHFNPDGDKVMIQAISAGLANRKLLTLDK